jgi:hypothetical protein
MSGTSDKGSYALDDVPKAANQEVALYKGHDAYECLLKVPPFYPL